MHAAENMLQAHPMPWLPAYRLAQADKSELKIPV